MWPSLSTEAFQAVNARRKARCSARGNLIEGIGVAVALKEPGGEIAFRIRGRDEALTRMRSEVVTLA
jgi:hypothetical protein